MRRERRAATVPLVLVGQADGLFEYRTSPDTFVKVVGHDPDGDSGRR